MNINYSYLTKTQLYDTIISSMSDNQLEYKFLKSNQRHYYFRRPSGYEGITDLLTITAYFKNAYLACRLQSCMFEPPLPAYSLSSGLLNRTTFLFNSQSASLLSPATGSYLFQQDLDSLISTMALLLSDLHVDGKEFVTDCDNRYSDPKFLLGMEYIKNLTVSKEVIKALLPTHYMGYWMTIDHVKFRELTHLFDEIDKNNNVEENRLLHGRSKSNYSNSDHAFEFFVKYVTE